MAKPKRSLLQRLRFKYKIFILNENTLEETFHIRLSRLTVYLYVGFFTLISFVIISAIILLTPLKHFLPGYADISVRSEMITENLRIDSLLHQMALQNDQLTVIKMVIDGSIPLDTIAGNDSAQYTDWSQLALAATAEEVAFRDAFEESEKYNLGSLPSPQMGKEIDVNLFFKPIRGTVLKQFDLKKGDMGITLVSSPQEGVLSALEGTVISTDYSLRSGLTIVVQHPNGFISVYKNMGRLMKQPGDAVKAGEVIGIVGDSNDPTSGPQLYYELWQNGKALNPSDYIIF